MFVIRYSSYEMVQSARTVLMCGGIGYARTFHAERKISYIEPSNPGPAVVS